VTWLSLDAEDNDPVRFWTYISASVRQIDPGLASGALTLLQSPQVAPFTSILTSLINDIASYPDSFSTVLEDYHEIEARQIHEALAFLLAHSPPNFHLVISTRADPPLPVTRLRAREQLTELRANDLRFTADEAAAFLSQVMGLDLSGRNWLLEAHGGWVAACGSPLSRCSREDI
jgi:LuxR family maltose regulon positive regulatory protein